MGRAAFYCIIYKDFLKFLRNHLLLEHVPTGSGGNGNNNRSDRQGMLVNFKAECFMESATWKRVQGVIWMLFCSDLNVHVRGGAFAAIIQVPSKTCH